EAFSSVVAILAQSLTVLIYAYIGVPVSVSQAIVGAVVGVGLARGSRNFDGRLIRRILLGWLQTPLIAGCVSAAVFAIFSFFGLN
ncbi:MAG TPA: inorganic phosphate transporter, partial [Mesotoga infera]|nr:inorganic phosphate transporter [Mesotoga infera]